MIKTETILLPIVAEHLGIDIKTITPASRFEEDFGADSLDLVELGMACEEAFDIELNDDAVQELTTFQSLVDMIEKKQAEKAQSVS